MVASKAQQATTAQRRSKALAMRLAGATYDKIAYTLGYSGRGAAQKDVTRALETARREMTARADELRDLEVMRLDRLQVGLWSRATGGDYRAVDTLLRLMDRRARLLGLDRPAEGSDAARTMVNDLFGALGMAYHDMTARNAAAADPLDGDGYDDEADGDADEP